MMMAGCYWREGKRERLKDCVEREFDLTMMAELDISLKRLTELWYILEGQ